MVATVAATFPVPDPRTSLGSQVGILRGESVLEENLPVRIATVVGIQPVAKILALPATNSAVANSAKSFLFPFWGNMMPRRKTELKGLTAHFALTTCYPKADTTNRPPRRVTVLLDRPLSVCWIRTNTWCEN